MFHEFPYTNFSEMNLDWLVCMCKKNQGLHLAVVGDYLRLLNANNEVISSVQVSYAEKALTDVHGRDIDAYIFSAGTNGDAIVFTHGDNTITSIVVPYSEKSKYDINHNEITDYVMQVQVAGQKLRITKGDGTITEIVVPFATSALQDTEGNDIKTYACELTVDGNKIVLRDRAGRVLNEIVPNYAVSASKDEDGDVIADTYGTTLDTGTTTVVLKNKSGSTLSTITVPYATEAGHTPNADLATVATDCTNAVESVVVSGDQIIFTTYGGTQTAITSPYSVKSLKDSLGNEIKSTYVANVTQDAGTGALNFLDAEGHVIVTLVPTVDKAIHDSYNNVIADYVKQILVDSQSNYVTVTHGTGAVETLIINYATHALNDINEQAIHNTYITYIECVEDVNDGHYKLVCYNGDVPKAELFRFEVTAYSAQTDINGKDLTTYVADVGYNAGQEIEVKDGNGNILNTLRNALDDLSDVETNQLLTKGDLLGYDGTDWTNVELEVALDDLTDVTIDATSLADGDVITYDANANKWVNKASSVPDKDVNNNSLGLFVDATSTWTPNDILAMNYIKQDHTLIAGDLPVISYKADRVGHPISCGILDWRIHTNAVILPYSPIAFFNEVALGTIDSFITNATVEMWFAYPEDSTKQIKVTVVVDVTNVTVTSNSATIVTVGGGGGGSGLPSNPHCIVGDFANGGGSFVYTAGTAASIVAGAKYGQKLAITLNGTDILYCAGVTVRDENTSTYIFDKDAVQVIEEAGAGTLTTPTSIKALFYTKYNNDFVVLEVEIVLAGGTIVSNGGNVA